MSKVICCIVEDSFSSWAMVLFVASYIYVMWVITHMQVMLSSLVSLVSFSDTVDSSGEIVIYVVYVVSCMGLSLLSTTGY